MVADQYALNFQDPCGTSHDSHQVRHEVGSEPAVLLVQKEERSVLLRRQIGEGKQPQANRKNVGNRAALALHNVLVMAVPFDVELDPGGIIVSSVRGVECCHNATCGVLETCNDASIKYGQWSSILWKRRITLDGRRVCATNLKRTAKIINSSAFRMLYRFLSSIPTADA